MRKAWVIAICLLAAGTPAAEPRSGPDGKVATLLARIKAVQKDGVGNSDAARAWKELVRLGPEVLPEILAALDNSAAIAGNWLRTAVDAIAERELAAGRRLPTAKLEDFVKDVHHAGPARRLAYEWLTRADPTTPDRLLPTMLHDPGAELRRDAVAVVIEQAGAALKRGDRAGATASYRKALSGALDPDQVDQIAGQLKTLGVPVDLAAHFGFVRHWQLLGPYDGSNGIGFDKVYPPENGSGPTTTYIGKNGVPLRWTSYTTPDPHGVVDLNKAIGKHMGAVAYARAVVDSPAERPVELRAGSNNGIKIFLNGKLLFAREEYHHGMRMDQHVGRGRLRAGRNVILLKVCQNEQKEDWAQNWSFQLRVCDAVGAAVPVTVVTDGKGKP